MRKIFALIIFFLATGIAAHSQAPLPELEQVGRLKLLEATRGDVRKIFGDAAPETRNRPITTPNAGISVNYSSGRCADPYEDWNVPAGRVTEIRITFKQFVNPRNLGLDLSKLRREKRYANVPDVFLYYDKARGVGYEISQNRVVEITFRPPREKYSLLCDKKAVGKFYAGKSWFREKLKERRSVRELKPVAHVLGLILSKEEITAACDDAALTGGRKCPADTKIMVETDAESSDPADVLVYNYTVSGGRVVGNGALVTWDLSGVKPGIYTITASVDNGCGLCGRTMTKTVVVRECADCR